MTAHRLTSRSARPFLAAIALAVVATALVQPARAARAAAPQDVTIASADGTAIAASVVVPDGTPPAGGWPAIVFLHGLAGNRSQGLSAAEAMGVTSQYVVLAYDARGHGTSAGKVELDGPREVADARAAFEWLRDRPDVSDTKIGGALFNSLVAGVPWAAAETVITFSDLTRSLYPQGLAKSGIIAGFIASLDLARVDATVTTARDAAFKGDSATVEAFGAARSSISRLGAVKTPVYVMQGRRDFAFDLDQGLPAFKALGGPKKLWLGNIGHAVSSFPGPDTPAMLAEGREWFDRYLRGEQNGVDTAPPVTIAGEGSARVTTLAAVPPTTATVLKVAQAKALPTRTARASWTLGPTTKALEVFGAPTVTVDATASGGWSRIIVVLTAKTKGGVKLISVGGAPSRPGAAKTQVKLISTATVVPAGSKLTVTVAASSATAPGTAGLTYLDLPFPDTAKLAVKGVTLSMPVLKAPIPS
jgi:predicted acyl esterase